MAQWPNNSLQATAADHRVFDRDMKFDCRSCISESSLRLCLSSDVARVEHSRASLQNPSTKLNTQPPSQSAARVPLIQLILSKTTRLPNSNSNPTKPTAGPSKPVCN